MRLTAHLLDFFFHHLYHSLAFAYDWVAWTVSLGRWSEWTETVIPYARGTRLLELGHGPGHLQRALLDLGLAAVGLDESAQMSRLARRRLHRSGYAQVNLTRGLGQSLPFAAETFDSIVAAFPAPYIAEARTLSEARRVLRSGGRFIVLFAAWPKNGILRWVYRVTGEAPSEAESLVKKKTADLFQRARFDVRIDINELESGRLLIAVAQKPAEG